MTTTGERLVSLSGLPGVETAMTHFVAIETGTGPGGTVLFDFADLELRDDVLTIAPDETLVIQADDRDSLEDDGGLVVEGDADLEVGCE